MSEPAVALFFLALISGCVVVITAILVRTAKALRRTLKRVDHLLPQCGHAVQEGRQTIGQTKELLTRTNNTARTVETAVSDACDVVTEILDQMRLLETKAKVFLGAGAGNGVKGGPRRHARRRHEP